ncbi:MAG: hypothetical protein KBT69_14230 [Oceanihabitans sp.]|nr:hypothetical protein [Oceanihabitans sp.]
MKLKYILPILLFALFLNACSSDDDNNDVEEINEVEGLIQIQEITNTTHTIELFNKTGEFKTGYNAVSIRVKDNTTNSYVENASISWMPMMQMPTMQHSGPNSNIVKEIGKNTVYVGYIVYQMTNTDGSGWSLTLNYSIGGTSFMATDTINVIQNDTQNVASFMGSDGSNYIIAMVAPNDPIIGINDLKVGLFKMESMLSFPEVADYTIMLDPRMPGMGNHSSPNNTDLTYSLIDNMYHSDLSLTMTGYWVLNMKLMNSSDTLLKGEDVTETNVQSSLYLELEF